MVDDGHSHLRRSRSFLENPERSASTECWNQYRLLPDRLLDRGDDLLNDREIHRRAHCSITFSDCHTRYKRVPQSGLAVRRLGHDQISLLLDVRHKSLNLTARVVSFYEPQVERGN